MKTARAFLLFTVFVAAAAAAQKQAPGEKVYGLEAALENMKRFTAAEGLSASLFAAEPMIQNPTNIDIDQRGRVWATEAVNYRVSIKKWGTLRPEGDRVVILEDTDGDGLADKETTFYQDVKLTNPLGICVLPQDFGGRKGTQVIVSAAPNVWLLTDADGDDKAEKKELLFTVGGNWDHDHQVHAFSFGPDGKFYFNMGNESKELKDADGKVLIDLAGHRTTTDGKPYRGGMVFRCDLIDGKPANIETLGWNFRNNYEVCTDSFGTLWQSDNDDDGNKAVRINYVMDGGNYGYSDEITGSAWQTARPNIEKEIPLRHWHLNDPGVVPNLLQTGSGSPTGILVNEGALLGTVFRNQIIHADAGPRVVRAYPVTSSGAGYTAEMRDILTSSDEWFRPSDVCIAPDGALFVADWYDPGVGGHNMQDHIAGKIRGRIYRVAPSGVKASVPKLDFTNAAGAIAALQSPSRATQYMAWQTLHAMGAKAEPELAQLWKSENPRLRARALGLLAQIKGAETKHLTAGLSDADSDVRVSAVRLCKTLSASHALDTTPLEENRELMGRLMRDPSAAVRRQIALSLGGAKDVAKLWSALARQYDGKDRWYLEALGIGARGNEDACLDAWLYAIKLNWNTPAGRDLIWRSCSLKSAGLLADILENKETADAEKPRFIRAFDFLPEGAEKTTALVELAGLGDGMNVVAAEALSRLKNVDMNANPAVKTAIGKQLEFSKGTPPFIEIVREFKLTGFGAELLATALKNPRDPMAGDALQLVLADVDAAKIIGNSLAGADAENAISLLGGSSKQTAVDVLAQFCAKPETPLPLQIAVVKALARTQTGARAMLQLAKNNGLPAGAKSAAAAALRLVQYPDLKTEIATLFPAPAELGGKPLPPIATLAKIQGDTARGKAIFEKAESSCITCHRVGDKGIDFGPALTEIGSKLAKEVLYESIIDPNAGVSMGFETTQLETKDGTVGIGIVRSETSDELVLALPGGVTTSFSKNQIAKRVKLPTSMMPSGLNQALNQQDLVDLVEYLFSLKKG